MGTGKGRIPKILKVRIVMFKSKTPVLCHYKVSQRKNQDKKGGGLYGLQV